MNSGTSTAKKSSVAAMQKMLLLCLISPRPS